MELSNHLERFTCLGKTTYILYGTYEALGLYKESLKTLINSDCFDFDILECSNKKPSPEIQRGLFNLDGYAIIDEYSHHKLHLNLCKKVRKVILGKSRKRYRLKTI